MNSKLPFYPDYPIYIRQIINEGNSIFIYVEKNTTDEIDKIEFIMNDDFISFNYNNSLRVNVFEIYNNSNFNCDINLSYVEIESKKIHFEKDKLRKVKILPERSIYNYGYERFLYKNVINQTCGIPKKEITSIAEDYGVYWNCCCGETNVGGEKTCINCGANKDKIFNCNVSVNSCQVERVKKNKVELCFLFIFSFLWLFQLFFQGIYGDFYFTNNVKNYFFGSFNRFIVPFCIILFSLLCIYFRNRYSKLVYVFEMLKLLMIIYLNILFSVYTIITIYNIIIVYYCDLFIIFNSIYSLLKKKGKIIFLSPLLLMVPLIIGFIKINNYKNLELEINKNGIEYTVKSHDMAFVIPNEIDKIKVTSINFYEKYNCDFDKITLSKNVEKIYTTNASMFKGLSSIDLNGNDNFILKDGILFDKENVPYLIIKGITELRIDYPTISKNSFYDLTSLEKVTFSNKVEVIMDNAFNQCINLKEVIFEDESCVTEIGEYAFANCKMLKKVRIPKSVKKMGIGVFENCISIESVETPFIGAKRENSEDIANCMDILTFFFGKRDYRESSCVPQSLKKIIVYDIDRIHNVTFYNVNSLSEIILPDELIHLGKSSFYGCTSLKYFDVPKKVTTIDEYCFANCESLEEIYLPKDIKIIKKNAFINAKSLVKVIYEGNINDLLIENEGNEYFISALSK